VFEIKNERQIPHLFILLLLFTQWQYKLGANNRLIGTFLQFWRP